MALMDGVNALSNLHGLAESVTVFNLHFLLNSRFEASNEFVQLLCSTHVWDLQHESLEPVNVFLDSLGLREMSDGVPGNFD